MERSTLAAILSFDGCEIAGHVFRSPLPLGEYERVLGGPSRSIRPVPGPDSNIIHAYDDLGLYLLQDHRSGMIAEISFVIDPARALFDVPNPWAGSIMLFDATIRPDDTETTLGKKLSQPLNRFLPGVWSARAKGVYLCLETHRRRTASGGRTKARYVSEVSCCFGE